MSTAYAVSTFLFSIFPLYAMPIVPPAVDKYATVSRLKHKDNTAL